MFSPCPCVFLLGPQFPAVSRNMAVIELAKLNCFYNVNERMNVFVYGALRVSVFKP